MSMPDPGQTMHVASVNYAVTFARLNAANMPVTFSAPGATSYLFEFDTGHFESLTSPGTWEVIWDDSWFRQAQVETAIAATLDQNCAAIATLLGLSTAQVQAAVIVRRLWAFGQNTYQVIPGVTSGPQQVVIPDVMQYPTTVVASAALGGTAGVTGSAATA